MTAQLSPGQQQLLDELDALTLRIHGPTCYARLEPYGRALVAWELVCGLLESFTPPIHLGPMPAEWRP